MKKEFGSVRDYSREIQKGERNKTAESLRAKRKEYFTNKDHLQKQLQKLVYEAEAKKIQAGEVRANIESAETKIEQDSQNFITKLLERRQIRRLQAEVGTAKVTQENIAQDLAALESARLELQKSLEDRTVLGSARKELASFYQTSEKSWNDYEDDRQAGNIKNIMRERGAFIVHAFINPTLSPSGENGLIRQELGWRDKLDLLILEPSLSASAVDKNHPKTFAPVGVLLGDGQVKRAANRDMGTRASSVKSRSYHAFSQSGPVREQIDAALSGPNEGWTEFEVTNAKVAGLFFRLDEEYKVDDIQFGSDATMQEIITAAKERGLPLFAMKEGEFYSITQEEALALSVLKEIKTIEKIGLNTYAKTKIERSKFEPKKENLLTAQVAAELPTNIDERKREAILDRFMTDSPFQLHLFPEAQQVASRAEGQSLYYLYKTEAPNVQEANKKKTAIPAYAAGNVDPIEVTIVKTVLGPTHLEHSVELNDGSRAIWKQSRNPVSADSRFRAGSTYYQDRLITRETSLNIGQIFIQTTQRPKQITDLIEAAKKEIQNISGWVKKWEDRGESLYAERNKRIIKNLASSLYGIAEEAKNADDPSTAKIAQNVAMEFYPLEEYQNMIERRVSESGTFKISREELLGK